MNLFNNFNYRVKHNRLLSFQRVVGILKLRMINIVMMRTTLLVATLMEVHVVIMKQINGIHFALFASV